MMKSDTCVRVGKVKVKRLFLYMAVLVTLSCLCAYIGFTGANSSKKLIALRDTELAKMKQQVQREMRSIPSISARQIKTYARYQDRQEKDILKKYPSDREISLKKRTYYGLASMFALYAAVLMFHSYQQKKPSHSCVKPSIT